jgi:hypothetical protein
MMRVYDRADIHKPPVRDVIVKMIASCRSTCLTNWQRSGQSSDGSAGPSGTRVATAEECC